MERRLIVWIIAVSLFQGFSLIREIKKSSEFGTGNAYATDNTGLNFIKRGGELKLIFIGEPINFCPWCGSRIEIKKMKDVTLEPKTKEIPDGYKEIEEVMT